MLLNMEKKSRKFIIYLLKIHDLFLLRTPPACVFIFLFYFFIYFFCYPFVRKINLVLQKEPQKI